jgi:opacity protein-like surface antigen
MGRFAMKLALVILLTAANAAAQTEFARFEIAGGYSLLHTHKVAPSKSSFNLHGGSASLAVNVTDWLGLVGDFGYYRSNSSPPTDFGLNIASYMFGPRLSYRGFEHFSLFAQELVGVGHAGGTLYTEGFASGAAAPGPVNALAMTLGGGLDYNLTRNLALRAFQGEWLYTTFPNGAANRQNSLRLTFGLVFRFGR